METLRDGQPKLQQAFLNIINIIFSSLSSTERAIPAGNGSDTLPSTSTSEGGQGGQGGPGCDIDSDDLRTTRQFFLKSPNMTAILLRLVEHGASSAVRAKALLAIQLICRHQPSLLSTLTEKRFSACLIRILEPNLASQSGALGGGGNTEQSSYVTKAAASMVLFCRAMYWDCCNQLAIQLECLGSFKLSEGTTAAGDCLDDDGDGMYNAGGRDYNTPGSQYTPYRTVAGNNNNNINNTIYNNYNNNSTNNNNNDNIRHPTVLLQAQA